jgi:hypothetical protein
MAKKQTHESMGFPSAGSKGDNHPIVRRRPMPGGKVDPTLTGGKGQSDSKDK